MSGTKYVSLEIKKLIVAAAEKGMKQKELEKLYNVKRSTISKLLKGYKERGNIISMPKSGRPKKISKKVDQWIVGKAKFNPKENAVSINKELKQFHGIKIDDSTVSRGRQANNLFERNAEKKRYKSKKNRQVWLRFARQHLNGTSTY